MAAAAASDLRARFDAAPMARAQIAAVAVTIALSALDGYDVLSVTFAAPAIAIDWGIGKAALGVLLSAGLAGMALGSLGLAPFADMVGRRRMVLASLVLMAAGMLLSAFAHSLPQLVAWRVLTGLGIGAMVAVINPLAAEFANARRRSLALALMAMGYPLGGLVGGLAAALFLRLYGWPAVFLAGAVAAGLLLLVVLRFLPEPLAFLLARPRQDGLARVNALLARCG
ncbi:MFS transporter, partial [Sphingomonas bacterium]|uniref:MFS transporter n=1 Tax=Sphingomonas bacterium TaxID=1895847 RepID=UPI001576B16C